MAGFGDILKKAVYLGVGLASYASEKAGATLTELRSQVQKLADEAVSRGEMTTEEARRFVEDMMKQAQQPSTEAAPKSSPPSEPRRIEILSEDEEPKPPQTPPQTPPQDANNLRQQVESLRDELKRLQNDQ